MKKCLKIAVLKKIKKCFFLEKQIDSYQNISTCAVGKCTQLCKIVNIAEKFQELYLLKAVSVLVKSNRFC